jgi:predicted ABC-type ATPase
MPEFLIIAGPNGAGKSSFSQLLSKKDAIIFDPDKEKLTIERQYPDINDDAVEEELTRVYNNFELRAAGSQLNFTVETNLRNNFLAERAKIFRDNGYETNLIFLNLPFISDSIDRVDLRVKEKGHFVSIESIRYNFEHSFQNFKKVAPQFDKVMLMDGGIGNSRNNTPVVLAVYNKGELIRQQDSPSPENAIYIAELASVFGQEPGISQHRTAKR